MNPLRAAVNFYRLKASWLGDGGSPVAPNLAQQRADVCLVCPLNEKMPIWESLAQSQANQLRKQLELKASMKLAVRGEDGLHTCKACMCLLKLKIFAPKKRILEVTKLHDLHPDCWILKEKALDTPRNT